MLAVHRSGEYMKEQGIDGLSRPHAGAAPTSAVVRQLHAAAAPYVEVDEEPAEDYKFLDFDKFSVPGLEHDVDACADEHGFNLQAGCARHFQTRPYHLKRPFQGNWREVVGHTVWINPPFSRAGEFIEAMVKAYTADPVNTRATLVLPMWTSAAWYQKYVARRNPLLVPVLPVYPERKILFSKPRPGPPSRLRDKEHPTNWEVGVFRLGAWPPEAFTRSDAPRRGP